MDIYIYDHNATLIAVTDAFTSLLWTKRFFKYDEFTAVFPATKHNLAYIKANNIIEIPDKYCGFITSVNIAIKDGIETITATGVSIDGMLSRRIIAYGEPTDSLMVLLDKNAGAASVHTYRKFESTVFDTAVSCEGMLNDAIKYKVASDYVELVGKAQLFGVKAKINHKPGGFNEIQFYGRYGVDRSAEQKDNTPVVFTDVYENISDCEYNYNAVGSCNAVVVYSEAKENYAKDINIDAYTGCSCENGVTGYAAIERAIKVEPIIMYKSKASSESVIYYPALSVEAMDGNLPDWRNANKAEPTDSISAKLKVGADYAKYFDVGDVVTIYSKRWDIIKHERIYEISEQYDNDGVTIEATTGSPLKELSDLLVTK